MTSLENTNNDVPPRLGEMFINSTDTLRQREIVQEIPATWNDRPPLLKIIPSSKKSPFVWRAQKSQPSEDAVAEEEDPNLLKGMIRKGIPPSLRCAVWLSNIIQSSRFDQDSTAIHEFRTLAKVQVVDGVYDSLWECDNKGGASSSKVTQIVRKDVKRVDFGNDTFWKRLDEERCAGRDAVESVLYTLHHSVLGGLVEYAPLLSTLVTILLGFMSESYAFYACREMYHNSAWFFATSRTEHIATQRAFSDVLGRLHPNTLSTMKEQDVVHQYTKEIFQNFFIFIFPERMVLRLMDIYSLEGTKVLFRFGVALVVLYGKLYKDHYMYASTEPNKWWLGLVDYCHGGEDSQGLNYEVLVKKSYGVHGRGVRQRFRFPRRPILSRIIEIEEEKCREEDLTRKAESEEGGVDTSNFYLEQIEPLEITIPPQPNDPNHERVVPRLAVSSFVRKKLAEWLPLSLRCTKLDLVFSTSYHGRTLENLYRCLAESRHTITILEPLDDSSNKFIGMYASHTWHPSNRVYGDGRCFLFRIDLDDEQKQNEESERKEDLKDRSGSRGWKWRPPDLFDFESSGSIEKDNEKSIFSNLQTSSSRTIQLETFQVSTHEFLSMGANEQGGAGLRLNEDLTKGESSRADGFDNEPLLGVGGLFEVGIVEVYQLVRQMDGGVVR